MDLADSVELDRVVNTLNAPFRQCSFPGFASAIAVAALLICEPGCKSPAAPGEVVASEAERSLRMARSSPNSKRIWPPSVMDLSPPLQSPSEIMFA